LYSYSWRLFLFLWLKFLYCRPYLVFSTLSISALIKLFFIILVQSLEKLSYSMMYLINLIFRSLYWIQSIFSFFISYIVFFLFVVRHNCKQIVNSSFIHIIWTNKVFITCKYLRIYFLYSLFNLFEQCLFAIILYRL
jgi:hypothetical protein